MSNCSRVLSVTLSILISLTIGGCTTGGGSSATPSVPDGRVVLVKKGAVFGALILRNQCMTDQEKGEYEWYYRTDGKGTFSRKERNSFRHGFGKVSGRDAPGPHNESITFGPFVVGWSGHMEGAGWLYYGRFPNEKIADDDVRICITSETSVEKVNATDSKWIYKGSPSDPGITAGSHR